MRLGIGKIRSIGLACALVTAATPVSAAPVDDAQKTELNITAGDAVLAGTLYRPAGAQDDLPAVVVGHGSGKVTRENTYWIDAALSTGLAALVFDKRGAGASTGTFPEWELETTPAMFRTLASDMVLAARLLATQKGIDPNRIGLMGGSQAGWVMPLAASQEPLIKFLIIGEGVPLPAGIEQVHSGVLDAVGDEGNPTLRQVSGADALALDYDGPLGYDPAPVLEGLNIPVLWLFGLYDGVIPVRQSIDRIGQLQKLGKRNHSVHIFPFGDHNFQNVFTKESYSVPEASRAWLQASGLMDREYLEALKSGSSDEHARIAWNIRLVEARLNPPSLPPASLTGLPGRYEGGRSVVERNGKLFYRRADGVERELIPLGAEVFGLDTIDSTQRLMFNRTDGVISSASFVTVAGPVQTIAREGS